VNRAARTSSARPCVLVCTHVCSMQRLCFPGFVAMAPAFEREFGVNDHDDEDKDDDDAPVLRD
jgi:hypothetical protein